jgi:predicted nucleotidyltransferase
VKFLKVLKSRNGKPIEFDRIKDEVGEICREFGVSLLYVFGSYATGTAYKLSDLDIGFLSKDRLNLDRFLKLLGRFQEIFGDEAVDLVDLSKVPLTLIHRVIKEGRCLYAQEHSKRIEFEVRNESIYYDIEPLRREYFEALTRRIKDGSFGCR